VAYKLVVVFGFSLPVPGCRGGRSAGLTSWPRLQTALSWVGAAYLIYLGWQLLRSSVAAAEAHSRPVSFVQATLFQFLNPKAWVMSLTAATLFLPHELGALLAGLYMALVMEAVGVPCMTVWALFGSGLKKFLAAPRARMVFNGVMAVALVATAVLMIR
jgi:threonine/homoserine/homoserine lactone efflux protein